MNSRQIKHAVMSYARFKRQWICASECLNSDVMIYTDKFILDVEIKISKYDLWKGEARKRKHYYMKNPEKFKRLWLPHKFYICVPPELLEEAFKWVKSVNNKYGIILCTETHVLPYNIYIKKKAVKLHNDPIKKGMLEAIIMRICSENIGLIGKNVYRSIQYGTK